MTPDDKTTRQKRKHGTEPIHELVAWRCRLGTNSSQIAPRPLVLQAQAEGADSKTSPQPRNEFSRLGFYSAGFFRPSSRALAATKSDRGIDSRVDLDRAGVLVADVTIAVMPNRATSDSPGEKRGKAEARPNQRRLLTVDIYCHSRCAIP